MTFKRATDQPFVKVIGYMAAAGLVAVSIRIMHDKMPLTAMSTVVLGELLCCVLYLKDYE